MPHFTFPSSLPISAHVDEITAALHRSQVVIVSGDTGSGKTTQLPKICLAAGRGKRGLIGVTQPRRLACLAMARRVAEEFGEEVGETIGYQHRFDKRLSRSTVVKFMTDGILLAETRRDRLFHAYDTLIIDEAHERSLNIDFLLGILHRILPQRPDLKLIISSATLDVKRFADFFGGAPIVSVPGRLYPIETRWRPVEDEDDADLPRQIADAVDELIAGGEGDILVFLPGERDIREAQEVLAGRHLPRTEIIPLLASLPAGEQQRAFQTSSSRRIILSTNVAETSVTIPGIRYVIDSGLARLNRYNPRTHVQRLQIEPISQASANQRQGRCGRVAPGVCIRLYDEDDFKRRDFFTPPEILRSSLAGVILTMLDLRLGDIETFPFIDPPTSASIRDGYAELEVLGALENTAGDPEKVAENHFPALSPLGRKLARLPLEPAFGRILFAAADEGVLDDALVVVASLECDDPRRRPMEQREEADRLHARFLTPVSDFSAILRLWRWYHDPAMQSKMRPGGPSRKPVSNAPLSQSALRRLCKANFLSYPKMRDWCDLRDQLADLCADLGLKNARIATSEGPSSTDAALHRALLTGLITSIGHRDPETNDYRGTRSIRFALFPGSGLAKLKLPKADPAQQPKRPVRGALPSSREWVLAGDLIETSRLFARTAACIDPAWIEPLARPICKYSYHSAEWDPVHGFVRVKERVMLLGLLLSDGRTRDDSRINPAEARELFIRQGLVEGAFPKPVPPFLTANLAQINALLGAEEKTRQHGLLFDPETAFSFYDTRLPQDVCSAPALRKWLAENPGVSLTMSAEDLPPVRDLAAEFPDSITLNGNRLPLTYRHAPGEDDDGVTCTVPARLLPLVAAWRSDWLVPGMLDEKLHWMLTSLPTRLRRLLLPLNETIERIRTHLTPGRGPLFDAVSGAIYETSAIRIPPETWKEDALPDHLRMRFAVVKDNEEDAPLLGNGRNIAPLVALFGPKQSGQSGEVKVSMEGQDSAYHRDNITVWDFGDLPAAVNVGRAGWPVINTPALVANEDGTISLRLFADAAAAAASHEAGVCLLFAFALGKEWKRLAQPPHLDTAVALYLRAMESSSSQFGLELAQAALREAFVEGQPAIRTAAEFQKRLVYGRARLPALLACRTQLAIAILFAAAEIEENLKSPSPDLKPSKVSDFSALAQCLNPKTLPDATSEDIGDQLAWLVFPGFAESVPGARLEEFPRYLEACRIRIERCRVNPANDLRKQEQIAPYWRRYTDFLALPERPRHDKAALSEYRWLVEEFRVSLFAQELRTPVPVSAKRLDALWEKVSANQ